MTLGALGSIHFHVAARRLGIEGGRNRAVLACHAGAALSCAVACLSNVVAAVIPLLITAWDLLTLARPKWRKILYGTAALWVIGAATVLIKKLGDHPPLTEPSQVLSGPWLLLILNVYWLNLKSLFWPAQLAVHYGLPSPEGFLEAAVILGAAATVLTCLLLWTLRRRKLMLFGVVWFALALAPTLQIMPHHIARADRFLYLPLVGLAVAAAMGLRPLGNALRSRTARVGMISAGVLGLLLLSALSARQVRTWPDSYTLWEHCVRVAPDNAFAHSSLADNLARRGQFRRAVLHYQTALRIRPDHAETLGDFAWFLTTCDDPQWRDYGRAVRLADWACRLTGRKAPRILHKAAVVYCNSADHLAARGEFRRAIRHYHEAIALDPEYDMPLFNLALLLRICPDVGLRQPDEAVRLAERACRLTDHPDARRLAFLAAAYAEAGRFDEAVTTAKKGIRRAEAAGDPQTAAELRRHWKLYQNRMPLDPPRQ